MIPRRPFIPCWWLYLPSRDVSSSCLLKGGAPFVSLGQSRERRVRRKKRREGRLLSPLSMLVPAVKGLASRPRSPPHRHFYSTENVSETERTTARLRCLWTHRKHVTIDFDTLAAILDRTIKGVDSRHEGSSIIAREHSVVKSCSISLNE